MSIFLIAVGIIIGILLIGALLAFIVARFDQTVAQSRTSIEQADTGYNPALTLGFSIKAAADPEEQVKEARLLAAKQAATLPRGGNLGIGRLGQPSQLRTAFRGAAADPWTAAKIAAIHGWDGVRLGSKAATAVATAPATPQTAAAAPTNGEAELIPGKDFPIIEISDDMSPAEKRKARIANAKAKSQATKAAKTGGAASAPAPAAAAVSAAAAAAPAAPSPAAMGIAEPNYIEITDSMSPDEVRKARIQNSKERSKYNKALKAAGIDPEATVPTAADQPADAAPPPAPAPAAAGADAAALAGIPKPDYIKITDDMSPDDLRKARIQNAKERSKYNKALKAAGIDPASVEE